MRLSLFGTIVTIKHRISVLPIFLLCLANKDDAATEVKRHADTSLMLRGAKTLQPSSAHSPYIWKLFHQDSNLHLDGRGVLEQNDVSHMTDDAV